MAAYLTEIEDFKEQLTVLGQYYKLIPIELKLVGHCWLVANLTKPLFSDRYVLSYWTGFLAAFGGGSLSALTLGVTPAFFSSNAVTITWTLAWYLNNYSPFNIVQKLWTVLPFFRWFCKILSTCTRAMVITGRCEMAVGKYPGIFAAPIFCGTLAGTGGGMMKDLMTVLNGKKTGPLELESPTWSLRSGLFASITYTGCVHWLGILETDAAFGLITSVMLLQTITSELIGRPIDPTAPFADLFHAISGIPKYAPKDSSKKKKKEGNEARGGDSSSSDVIQESSSVQQAVSSKGLKKRNGMQNTR